MGFSELGQMGCYLTTFTEVGGKEINTTLCVRSCQILIVRRLNREHRLHFVPLVVTTANNNSSDRSLQIKPGKEGGREGMGGGGGLQQSGLLQIFYQNVLFLPYENFNTEL